MKMKKKRMHDLLNKISKNKKLAFPMIAIISILIILSLSFLYYQMNLQPMSKDSDVVNFQVSNGESLNEIIYRLEEEQIIKNAFVAKVYAKLNGLHAVKAGSFQMDKAWDTSQVLSYLNQSENASKDQVKVTFREGIWAKDIAKQLEESLGIMQEEWIALWNDEDYVKSLITKYEFLDNQILNNNLKVKLEGFLYPETYYFSKQATKEEVTEVFLNHFQNIYESIKETVQASNLNFYELITLASMVQYESKTKEDMHLISGVFYNRLKIGMPLGSSVTICYALYDDYKNAEDCELNSTIDSPYNTYIHTGLPIGPILNPGLDAIMATLHPKENDYLYFMADIYGDGKVYYAKTQDEHDANVKKYLRR